MSAIAVAGLSARMMAEAAARDGFEVIALDVFGDADTRRAAEWRSIGNAESLRIDAARLLAALRELAARGNVIGWVPGSGFDGLPHLLAHGARLLPLLGTAAADMRRLRDPATFFAALREHGIAHPPTRLEPPEDATGWLFKDAQGSGGWHIRDAAHAPCSTAPHAYFQQRSNGVPMSATFIGNGERALRLGVNELIVRRHGARPLVFCGAVGPVAVVPAVLAQIDHALAVLAPAFRLRGLGSLDFMLDSERVEVLEVNARPPASMGLYEGPLMAAHVQACRRGSLPEGGLPQHGVRGHEIVFATEAIDIDAPLAALIGELPQAHDLPLPGSRMVAGEPLCSVGASGAGAPQVHAALARHRDQVLAQLQKIPEEI